MFFSFQGNYKLVLIVWGEFQLGYLLSTMEIWFFVWINSHAHVRHKHSMYITRMLIVMETRMRTSTKRDMALHNRCYLSNSPTRIPTHHRPKKY
jgi:hypothetical protein